MKSQSFSTMNKSILLISLQFILLTILSNVMYAQSDFRSDLKEHRKDYKNDFLEQETSPFYANTTALKGLKFFPPNKKYKVLANLVITSESDPFQIKTNSGKEKTFRQYAWAHFQIGDEKFKLAIYQNLRLLNMPLYRELLFIPFKDYTNGDKTYGGGRYIDLSLTDIKDNKIEIDFNKCYNPYCAFSSGYNCPVPPIDNHLPTKITAGEKMYKGPKLSRPE